MKREVPSVNITRFSAYDHRDYTTYDYAKHAAKEKFGGKLPPFLNRDYWHKSEYCWLWTWYTIIHKVSHFEHGFYLVLVDDCEIKISYGVLCRNIQQLKRVSNNEIRIISLELRVFRVCRKTVRDNDIFQYGLAGRGDMGIIYTPIGAQFMLEWANKNSEADTPSTLLESLTYERDQTGFFALSARYQNPDGGSDGVVVHIPEIGRQGEQNRLESRLK